MELVQFNIQTDYRGAEGVNQFVEDVERLRNGLRSLGNAGQGLRRVRRELRSITASLNAASRAQVEAARAQTQAQKTLTEAERTRAAAARANAAEARAESQARINALKEERAAIQNATAAENQRAAAARATAAEARAAAAAEQGRVATGRELVVVGNQRIAVLRRELGLIRQIVNVEAERTATGLSRFVGGGRGGGSGPTIIDVDPIRRALPAALAPFDFSAFAGGGTPLDEVLSRSTTLQQRFNNLLNRGTAAAGRLRTSINQWSQNIQTATRNQRLFNGTVSRSLRSVTALAVVFGTLGAIGAGVGFADQLVRAEQQVAGLVVATGRLVDLQGEQVSGTTAFEAAVGLAREQVQELENDARQTLFTFDDLLSNFQLAIGPALSQGFDLDQVRQFTLGVSQAASAVGLLDRDLPEEIRSLLTGNITRNSRLAQILEIQREDIQGLSGDELFQFLTERLEGFSEAALRLDGTIAQVGSNLIDTFLQVGARGLEPFRLELLNLFRAVNAQSTGLEGALGGNLLSLFTSLGRALSAPTEALTSLFANLDARDASRFGAALESIGDAAAAVIDAGLEPFLAGTAAGFQALSTVVEGVAVAFGALPPEVLAAVVAFRLLQTPVTFLFATALPAVARAVPAVIGVLRALALQLLLTGGTLSGLATGLRVLLGTLTAGLFTPVGAAVVALGAAAALAFGLFSSGAQDAVTTTQDLQDQLGDDDAIFLVSQSEAARTLAEELEGLAVRFRDLRREVTRDIAREGFSASTLSVLSAFDRVEDATQQLQELNKEIAEVQKQFQALAGTADEDDLTAQLNALVSDRDRLLRRQQIAGVRAANEEALRQNAIGQRNLAVLRQQLDIEARRQQFGPEITRQQELGLEIEENRIAVQREAFDLQQEINALEAIRRVAPGFAAGIEQRIAQLKEELALNDSLNAQERARLRSQIRFLNNQDREEQALESLQDQVQLRQRIVTLLEAQADALDAVASLQVDEPGDEQLRALAVRLEAASLDAESAGQSLALARQQNDLQAINDALGRQADAQAQLASLERERILLNRQLRQQQEAGAGLAEGLASGIAPIGTRFQNLGQSIVGELSGGIREAAAIAFDPNRNLDLSAGLEQIGRNIGAALLATLAEEFVLEPLLEGVVGLLDPARQSDEAALAAAGVALNTAAAQQIVAANLLAGAAASLAASAASSVIGAFGASPVGSTINAGLRTATTIGFGAFGAFGFNKGGIIPGFDSGGMVGAPNLAKSPAGTHPADRVLAALTPGEAVLNRGAVAALGTDFINAINRDYSTVRLKGKSGGSVPGFNSGGLVGQSDSTRPFGRGSASGSGGQPILVANSDTTRRILQNEEFDLRLIQARRFAEGS